MLAVDPLVIGVVVAVERLGEPVHGTRGAVLAAVHVVGLVNAQLVNDLLEVEGTAVAVLTVPEEVEQTDVALVCLIGADLGVNYAAELVDELRNKKNILLMFHLLNMMKTAECMSMDTIRAA